MKNLSTVLTEQKNIELQNTIRLNKTLTLSMMCPTRDYFYPEIHNMRRKHECGPKIYICEYISLLDKTLKKTKYINASLVQKLFYFRTCK